MAAWTFRRRDSLTGTDPVITCDTVPTETPATSATFFMLGIGAPGLQVFQADVLYFDFHRWPQVDLDSDQPVHLSPGCVVIDQHAHHPPVKQLLDRIAARDEPQGVPAAPR